MSVIERYNTPFDRFKQHDYSLHLNVDVVSRDDMKNSDKKTSGYMRDYTRLVFESEDNDSFYDIPVESNQDNTKSMYILWVCLAIAGFVHPVFTLVAYVIGNKYVGHNKALIMLLFTVVLWLVVFGLIGYFYTV